MMAHLEPDILECEVNSSIGSITIIKASGGDRIPIEQFPILNDDAVKVLHSIQYSCSVWLFATHKLQHAGPPCPSLTLRVYPNLCPLSQWCHPVISSSVVSFSSCPQYFPASGSFQMSQLFATGGQSIGVSASTSVLRKNTKDWLPLGWTGWVSLHPRDSQGSYPTP